LLSEGWVGSCRLHERWPVGLASITREDAKARTNPRDAAIIFGGDLMPRHVRGKVSLTESEEELVRGMNAAHRNRGSNIGALHFDGPDLANVLAVHREHERIAKEGAYR